MNKNLSYFSLRSVAFENNPALSFNKVFLAKLLFLLNKYNNIIYNNIYYNIILLYKWIFENG